MPKLDVKLLAVLKGFTDKPEFTIEVAEDTTLRDLVMTIAENAPDLFRKRFLNTKQDGLSPDIIALIDGADASIHGGMSATLKKDSEIVFLPTVHGG